MIGNLLLRSEYSINNSICSLDKIIEYAKENNITSLAICDIGNMYGAYKFYNLCLKDNIKPLIGVDLPFNDMHLLLYAIDNVGYGNLLKLTSIYNIKANINIDNLLENSDGIVLVINLNNIEQIKNTNIINLLSNSFKYCFIGITPIMLSNLDFIKKYNTFNIPFVAIHDTRYFNEDDRIAYRMLKSIEKRVDLKQIEEVDYSFYSNNDWQSIYYNHKEMLQNIDFIFNLANITIKKQENPLPKYSNRFDSFEYLKSLCLKGLEKRIGNNNQEYLERLKMELTVIKKMGFADYFLIVWDYVKYAKNNGILVGPGRGSAAGSLVSYLIGITEVDPIKYRLLFERFLNVERINMPDIDIDFPYDKRDEVIEYVSNKYGKNRVVKIVTFSTFALRSTIKEVANSLNISKIKQDELFLAINNDDLFDKSSEKLNELMSSYSDIKELVEISKKIYGLPQTTSTHAAGIIIANEDIINYAPIEKGDRVVYQSQYDAHDLESLGLLKMDFLALKNLTFIKNCLDLIKKDYPTFYLPYDFNDLATFELLNKADTTGIFQLESSGIRGMIKKVGINSFEDICQSLALYRPGPLSMIDTYASRKKGLEKVTYLDKSLEPILKSTFGIVLYQEQIMMIARIIAGYSLGEADILRRAVSKKQKNIMEEERFKFVQKSIQNGFDKDLAESIFEYIYKFADYGFNRSHSVAYSMISYHMAYMKAHYPEYFYSCMLNELIGSDSFDGLISEIKSKGINILIPDINNSGMEFIPSYNELRIPLTCIKEVGKAYAELIIKERENGIFTSFHDFIKRMGKVVPTIAIQNLIFAGSFDSFNVSKKSLIENLKNIMDRTKYSFVVNTINVVYDIEEYSYGYLLNKEREVIGMNIKYNYLAQYSGLYKKGVVKHIEQVKRINYSEISVLGQISSIRHITTKKGDKMAFITLIDETGSIEVTVFPRKYSEIQSLEEKMLIIVSGKVNQKDVNDKKSEKEIILESFRQV